MEMIPEVPWKLTRESDIRIDRDGRFWHEGARVLHPGLEQALASWVTREPTTGRYILKNTLDWCYVTVDDAPLAVRAVTFTSGDLPWVSLTLSDGTTELLSRDGVRVTLDGVVYSDVREGKLPARWDRTPAFTLLQRAVEGPDGGVSLTLGTVPVPLTRVSLVETSPG